MKMIYLVMVAMLGCVDYVPPDGSCAALASEVSPTKPVLLCIVPAEYVDPGAVIPPREGAVWEVLGNGSAIAGPLLYSSYEADVGVVLDVDAECHFVPCQPYYGTLGSGE